LVAAHCLCSTFERTEQDGARAAAGIKKHVIGPNIENIQGNCRKRRIECGREVQRSRFEFFATQQHSL